MEVTTAADVRALLGAERQRQLLGCEGVAESCMTELANALGADGVLVGTIDKVGESYLAAVKLISNRGGRVTWSASERLVGEAKLMDWLDARADELRETLAPSPRAPLGAFLLGGAGVAGLGVGATFLVLSNTTALTVISNAPDEPSLASALDAGKTQNAVGWVALSTGAALLFGGVLWGLLGSSAPPPQVSVVPVPGGLAFGFGGAL